MGIKKAIKKGFFSGYSVKRWVGFDQIKDSGQSIGEMATNLIDKQKTKATPNKETFEECVKRFGLSESDLKKKMKSLYRIALFCLAASLACFVYAIYLFLIGFILSGFVSLMLSFLLAAYAYREHLNYFQIKQRRLGCTFREWFNSTFKGVKA